MAVWLEKSSHQTGLNLLAQRSALGEAIRKLKHKSLAVLDLRIGTGL